MSASRRSDPLSGLARLLERANVEYALIGGHAVNVWLEPRFTAHVDVVVQAGHDAFERLKSVAAEAGFTLRDEHGAQASSGPDFIRFSSSDGVISFEVQAAKTELQNEVIRRAKPSESGMRVATLEDLIVLKLIADRSKDRLDLLGLVRLSEIDWAHVDHWARTWEVDARLRELRAQSKD